MMTMVDALQLDDIHHDFGGLEVLQGIHLNIAAGERHAIIGPNGAGKTTLTNIITGKYRPTKGHVYSEGREITGLAPHRLARSGISRSFQIINIFPDMTVFENIRNAVLSRYRQHLSPLRALRRLSSVNDDSDALIDLVGLVEFRGERASALPYGEQRSLEIGLTLAIDPRLIILDEPAAGMSTAEAREVTVLIRRVTEGRTLIFIEHDMDVVFSLADRISVLHHGVILAQGTPNEIRANPEVQASYLGE